MRWEEVANTKKSKYILFKAYKKGKIPLLFYIKFIKVKLILKES
jgi:hypothetical protein